jgi:hypothetical protein
MLVSSHWGSCDVLGFTYLRLQQVLKFRVERLRGDTAAADVFTVDADGC